MPSIYSRPHCVDVPADALERERERGGPSADTLKTTTF